MSADPFHDRLLKMTLALPGAVEEWPWGSIHCKVGGKIFVGWSRGEDGEMILGVRTDKVLQSMLVGSDPRFSVAKYTGKYGGIDLVMGKKPNWDEVENFIVESYRLIAPKKLIRELDAGQGSADAAAPKKKPRAPETPGKTARKLVTKKPARIISSSKKRP